MDENQWGFREGRSTADVTQVIVKMKEDANDYVKIVGRTGGEAREENDWMVARLLDLEKAYPRVSKPALWMSLERYGLKEKMLKTLIDLHETTEYKVHGKDGMSSAWLQLACEGIERGLLYLPYPVQYLPPGGIETGGGG